MNHLEYTHLNETFKKVSLNKILNNLESYFNKYSWSIQIIEAVGDITNCTGINISELEKICDDSDTGYVVSFTKLKEIISSLDDIIEILLIACFEKKVIPKAYSDENWVEKCDIIISKEDSSYWQFITKDETNLKIIKDFIET